MTPVADAPQVELLWWEGCPSAADAIERTREEMSRAGLEPEALVIREVDNERAAEREAFPGSPTVRVNGRDVAPTDDQPGGLTCRVYRLRDGRVSAVPDRADVAEALRAALGEARR